MKELLSAKQGKRDKEGKKKARPDNGRASESFVFPYVGIIHIRL
ncbi:hypothetical protein CLOM621_08496 [Clostridium sp. M62/1]|nr:hypothetical protein CLOM621_08496 [Clostridium sp. M62/1]